MRFRLLLALLSALVIAAPAHAVDHNNLDAGRPLSFDDAETIAFREQGVEVGVAGSLPRHRALGIALDAEYLYGFALNSQVGLGFHPAAGGQVGSRDTRFDFGDVSLGVLHSFNREYANRPALALRADASLPTGRGSAGVDFRLRGIVSKTATQYDRLHLNVDLGFATRADPGERAFRPGVILGYSRPLGYPRRFDRTGLAELALQSGPTSGKGPLIALGVGLRQQVTVRSVLDVGLQSDIASFGGATREILRLTAGYSTAF